jgi:1-hydroxycarotenoid 3,4-desaturase
MSRVSNPGNVPHVVIIGAGIAGLSAGIALLGRGVRVTLLEKEAAPGGKMRQVFVEGRPIDGGPTVFTMRWVFDELLDQVGRSLDDLVTLERADILARHAWTDGSRFDLFADRARAVEAVGDFAGAAEARRFKLFLSHAAAVFDDAGLPFMRALNTSLPSMMRRTGASGAAVLLRSQPHKSMWGALGKYFKDPRLRQLFGRYATYYGSSPFHCPPNLMLVAHAEQEGVWLVEGGMHRLATSLANLAEEMGGVVRLNAPVARVTRSGGAVDGVALEDGERIGADAVIVNGDCAAVASGLFGDDVRRAVDGPKPEARSLSAVTYATVARPEGFPLSRHTVFFSDAYRAEFDAVFRARRVPNPPTTYICAQDRGGVDAPPPTDRERLFFLINAPANGDAKRYDDAEIEQCERNMLSLLGRCGLTIREASTERIATAPDGFETLFPATGGALYGQASHGWTAFFARPANRARLPGLYLAGGSVHPGAGVPTAALSGRNAAACLMEDLDSTSRSVRTAMPGGT